MIWSYSNSFMTLVARLLVSVHILKFSTALCAGTGDFSSGSLFRFQNAYNAIGFTPTKTKTNEYQHLRYTKQFEGSSTIECLLRCENAAGDQGAGEVLMVDSACYCLSGNGANSIMDLFDYHGNHPKSGDRMIMFYKKENQNKKDKNGHGSPSIIESSRSVIQELSIVPTTTVTPTLAKTDATTSTTTSCSSSSVSESQIINKNKSISCPPVTVDISNCHCKSVTQGTSGKGGGHTKCEGDVSSTNDCLKQCLQIKIYIQKYGNITGFTYFLASKECYCIMGKTVSSDPGAKTCYFEC